MVMDEKSGITLANIQLAEESINEEMEVLASGIFKAIGDVLKELKIGQIKSLQTHKKQVILYKKKAILVGLICDIDDNTDIYIPKIEKIANLFINATDWEHWCGDVGIFKEIIKKSKKILILSKQEIISLLDKELKQIRRSLPELYGYTLFLGSKPVKKYINENIDDFELTSFLKSDFFSPLHKNIQNTEQLLLKIFQEDYKQSFFVDYEHVSIFIKYYFKDLYVVIFLPGMLDPIADLPTFEEKITKIGVF
jgi:hypothetical protein